jgi:hypothetical protein
VERVPRSLIVPAVVAVLTAGALVVAPAATAAPPGAAHGLVAKPLAVAGRVVATKPAEHAAARGATPARPALAPAAVSGPEGVPSVAPGSTPAGYLPLDQFGIAPTPIGDEEFINLTVPQFVFANREYTSIAISSNGYLKAGTATAADQNCCNLPSGPDPAPPNGIIAPFWTDLDGTGSPGIYAGTLTDGVSTWVVVEWRVHTFGTTSQRVFEAWIGVNGTEDVSMVYDPGNLPAATPGQDHLVGAENSLGQGAMSPALPTVDLRVTSSVAVYASSVAVVSGDGQTAEGGQPFAAPLVVAVTGSDGQPFAGETVTYTVTSGTASFGGSATATAVSDASGRATSPPLTAGGTAGPVTVTASTTYSTPVTFSLTVTRTAAAVSAVSGGGQSAPVGQPFAQPLVAGVTARDGGALAGAPVTFTVTSGSASFAGAASATASTGTDGRATSPTLTAGNRTGTVTVTATTPGVAQGATFTLTVGAASADLSAALAGPAGTVRPRTPFTVTLTVRNAGPSPASTVASGLVVPSGTRIVNGGGGLVSRDARSVAFLRASLAAGASVTYTVTLVADGGNGTRTVTAATASLQTRDPSLADNAARTVVTVRR